MSRTLLAVLLIAVAAVVFAVVQVARPAGAVQVSGNRTAGSLRGISGAPAWPSGGESAVGVEGEGLLASHGAQSPVPLGSVTKIMTADVILHDHPLAPGEQGPVLTVSATDVATFETERAATDSVVAVQPGEQLTELQALEALLIPSGDNIALLLADWDAGSEGAFVAKMNAQAKSLGLTHTHYADPAGLRRGSQSTAADQARLAMATMADPVFRSIVDMAQVTLPVAGLQYNVNALLGTDGIVGVKTGFITQSGGCLAFAATTTVGTTAVTVVGAVLGQQATRTQPSALEAAFGATTALLPTVDRALTRAQVVRAGQTLGTLHAAWASAVPLRAANAVSVLGLAGERVRTTVHLPHRVPSTVRAGERLGSAVVSAGAVRQTVPLLAGRSLSGPSLGWRLTDV